MAPCAAATPSAIRRTRAKMSARIPSSKVRIVPTRRARSGMMLLRTPASNWPTVTTAGSRVMSSVRDTTVWSAVTISLPTTIGSIPDQGFDPWVWRPWTRISKRSAAARSGPGR